ncbi:MAG: cold shock domain-containing protein [Marinilabiliaceae bacterium]|nr:cold shock domain-containing protein [Marinilabiliaceae bacterium]
MGRSKETFGKKDVRNKKLKKRKDKEKSKLERKEQGKSSFDDMIAWVDENGQLCSERPAFDNKEEIKIEDIEISIPKGGSRKNDFVNRGIIKNFEQSKGFGFIQSSNQPDSYFFHVNDCIQEVKPGDKVEYDIEKSPKGMKAVNVKLAV